MSKMFFEGSSQANPPPKGVNNSERNDAARARPARLARLGRFPKDEVHGVALIGRNIDAGAGEHFVERTARERSIAWGAGIDVHCCGGEEHIVFGDIGETAPDEPFDNRLHFGDMIGRVRLFIRLTATEGGGVLMKLLFSRLRNLGDSLIQRKTRKIARGARVDLVVDVRDVAGVDDMLRPISQAQQAEEDVENN
jgi:hypothetical protein